MAKAKPKSHHLDRRVAQLIQIGIATPNDDELLSTQQLATWLGVSEQWLEVGRSKNYGPRYERLSPRVIKYKRSDVIKWLATRSHASTAEYATKRRRAS